MIKRMTKYSVVTIYILLETLEFGEGVTIFPGEAELVEWWIIFYLEGYGSRAWAVDIPYHVNHVSDSVEEFEIFPLPQNILNSV